MDLGSISVTVNEIFFSIQGESLYTGLPCVFIRLTGCNLRCRYCDTEYAYHEGTETPIPDILDQVSRFGCPLIEITGGEPLLQDNTPLLVRELIKQGYKVLIETNGSKDISVLDTDCIKILDIKCPSSGESHANNLENFKLLGPNDQLKFVIETQEDFTFARTLIASNTPGIPEGNILFSPVSGKLSPSKLAGWILDSGMNSRLHLQMHKIIWPEIDRGV